MSIVQNHNIVCVDGVQRVHLKIEKLTAADAVKKHQLSPKKFFCGGWQVEGSVNGVRVGRQFYPDCARSKYRGDCSKAVAQDFLILARSIGILKTAEQLSTERGWAKS